MAACRGCGERDGGIGHGKRRSRTGLARVCGDVQLVVMTGQWQTGTVRQEMERLAIERGHDRTGLPKASAVADAV